MFKARSYVCSVPALMINALNRGDRNMKSNKQNLVEDKKIANSHRIVWLKDTVSWGGNYDLMFLNIQDSGREVWKEKIYFYIYRDSIPKFVPDLRTNICLIENSNEPIENMLVFFGNYLPVTPCGKKWKGQPKLPFSARINS